MLYMCARQRQHVRPLPAEQVHNAPEAIAFLHRHGTRHRGQRPSRATATSPMRCLHRRSRMQLAARRLGRDSLPRSAPPRSCTHGCLSLQGNVRNPMVSTDASRASQPRRQHRPRQHRQCQHRQRQPRQRQQVLGLGPVPVLPVQKLVLIPAALPVQKLVLIPAALPVLPERGHCQP